MRSVGFLTPYTGDNLGDGAIQDAVIRNIRRRWPAAHITGVTLSPARTSALHGVPCHPLTDLSIAFYNRGVLERHRERSAPRPSPEPRESTLKRLLRKASWAFAAARWCYLVADRVLRALQLVWLHTRHVAKELLYLPRAYRLASSFDLLIVSGGGQIDAVWGGAFGHPYALLKWGLLARLAGTPFVMLSVGVGEIGTRTSRLLLKHALRLAAYRSYRDEGSKRLLAIWPLTCADPVCPDLAFSFLPAVARKLPAQDGCGLAIGVNPISYLRAGSWPVASASKHEQYLRTLQGFIEGLLRNGHRVVLFPGDRGDHHVVGEMAGMLAKSLDATLLPRLSSAGPETAADLFSLLRSLDYVVASRLHSVILAHLACTPVMAISYERKVRVQMEAFAQAAHCLDIHAIDSESLRSRFAALRLHGKEVQDTLLEKSREAEAMVQKQYDDVLLRDWRQPRSRMAFE